MIRKPRPDQTMSTFRTEAYTDAVFAIAATLLVLDLTTKTIGEVSSDAELWSALAGMWPAVLGFVVSFLLLSLMWMTHVDQIRYVERVDSGLLWLNSIRLLFIVLIPFTTSVTSEYTEFYAGRVLLPINFFLAVLLGYATWEWAIARGLLRADVDPALRMSARMAGISAVVLAAVAAALSPLVGSWAFLVFVFNGLLARVLGGSRRVESS